MDMTGGEPGLLINLLTDHGQDLVYIAGVAVNRAADSYRGQGQTDARDARIIADGLPAQRVGARVGVLDKRRQQLQGHGGWRNQGQWRSCAAVPRRRAGPGHWTVCPRRTGE